VAQLFFLGRVNTTKRAPAGAKTMNAWNALFAVLPICSPLAFHCQPAPEASTCAQPRQDLSVSLDDLQHAIVQPGPGSALIYFVQDVDQVAIPAHPIGRVGIDGQWVGANMGSSYFAVAVEPGLHHLCAEVQSAFSAGDPEFDHLVAEAGKVYYFRTRIFLAGNAAVLSALVPIDQDQAASMIASYPRAPAGVSSANGFAPLPGSVPGVAREQSPPAPQFAHNGERVKTVRSHAIKEHASATDRGAAGSPKTPRDKSAGAASASAKPARRT
jgi:hypothetical protein